MTAFFRLVFLVPLGYIGAVFAAALTIAAGWLGPHADIDSAGYFAGAIIVLTPAVGTVSFLPAAAAIAASELFGWRSVFFFLAIGGGLGLIAQEFGGAFGIRPVVEEPWLLLPAAGFVGAFVYWLIAGRQAGFAEPTSPGSKRA